ncbi:MAG: NADH-quinone oxidoreductase subunit N [Candidatus Hodarchaeales archaeon]|jgi:NADH-quinone oxidoreductase subunit N
MVDIIDITLMGQEFDIIIILPLLIITVFAILCLLSDLTRWGRQIGLILALAGSMTAFILTVLTFNDKAIFLGGGEKTNALLAFDELSKLFVLIFLLTSFLVALVSYQELGSDIQSNPALFYSLLLFSTAGMMLVASATDLISLLVSWELGSIPTYAMVAFAKRKKEQAESALKFFMVGAFSTAIIAYGISLLYGLKGTTNLYLLAEVLATVSDVEPLEFLAIAFVIAGFGFKLGIVPFHAWIPDVYQASTTPVTTFLAAGVKKMGFAAVIRIFAIGLTSLDAQWSMAFAVIAIATMTLGNVVALVQDDVKRMLAYSSIAHAGYIIIAFAVLTSDSSAEKPELALIGVLFHVLAHTLMKIVAFVAVGYIAMKAGAHEVDEYAGVGKRHPVVALAFTVSLLSLMGIPPLGGFVSKFILFFAAMDAGMEWLAVIAVLNSALSVYYYARVLYAMWVAQENSSLITDSETPSLSLHAAVVVFAAFGIILMGIFAQPLFWAANKDIVGL